MQTQLVCFERGSAKCFSAQSVPCLQCRCVPTAAVPSQAPTPAIAPPNSRDTSPCAAVGLAKHPHLALQCKNKAFRSSSLTSASVLPVLWEGVPVSSVICAIPPCQRQARRSSKGGTSPWQHSTSYLRGLAQRYAGRACSGLHPASCIQHPSVHLVSAWHGTALPPMPACSHGKLCRRTDERLD